MFHKYALGLAEVQAGIQAMLEEAPKADTPERPMAFAIVDEHGDLIMAVRMDGALDFNVRMAIKKARSSARMKRSSRDIEERLRSYNRPMCDAFGASEDISNLPGADIIIEPTSKSCIGAVGASGRHCDVDESVARKGIEAIQRSLKLPK